MADPEEITLSPDGAEQLQKLQDDEPLPITPLPAEESEPAPEGEEAPAAEEPDTEASILARFKELKESNPELAKKIAEEAGLALPPEPDEQIVLRELELNRRERAQAVKQAEQVYNSWLPQNVAQEAYQSFSQLQRELTQSAQRALDEGDGSKIIQLDPQAAAQYVQDRVEKAQAAARYHQSVQIASALMDVLQEDQAHRRLSKGQRDDLAAALKQATPAEQLAATVKVYLEAARSQPAAAKPADTKPIEALAKLAEVMPKARKQAVAASTRKLDPATIEAMSDDDFNKPEFQKELQAAMAAALRG